MNRLLLGINLLQFPPPATIQCQVSNSFYFVSPPPSDSGTSPGLLRVSTNSHESPETTLALEYQSFRLNVHYTLYAAFGDEDGLCSDCGTYSSDRGDLRLPSSSSASSLLSSCVILGIGKAAGENAIHHKHNATYFAASLTRPSYGSEQQRWDGPRIRCLAVPRSSRKEEAM